MVVRRALFFCYILSVVSLKYKVYISSFECKSLVPHIQDVKCSVTKSSQSNLLNMSANITKPLKKVFVKNELYFKYSFSYKPFMINQTEDLCAYLGGDIKNGLVMNVVMYSAKSHFINLKCPLYGYINMTDYNLQLENYIGLLPHGDYRHDITLLVDKSAVWSFRTFAKYTRF